MFLVLSKVLDLLGAPLTWALLLSLPAILRPAPRPRLSRLFLALGIAQLLFFSLDPVARSLFARLEAGAADTFHPDPPYDVAVVLGGMVDTAAMGQSGQIEFNEAVERILRAAQLLRSGEAKAALLSAGTAFPEPGEPTEADALAAWLREEGIPPDRVLVENKSRNTRENAVESARIVAEHGFRRILLVTSAWHAPRALGCFRAVGLKPDLLAVDHRSGKVGGLGWLPRAAALSSSTDALHEMLGGLVYRMVGYAK
ncbi:MAG TPA: YdcF family protein [Anaeromyxobacter sp.]|nr:YdcF family protein [Anaeromyxobacter sp.]